jgi:hypothetical protein
MAGKSHSYVLLRDKGEGYPCGQLVELDSDSKYAPHFHSKYTQVVDPISADSDEVAPLTEEECRILDAIGSPADRYTVYSTPEKLAWGMRLKVGDTVLARLPPRGLRVTSGGRGHYTSAIIRWYGDIEVNDDDEKYLFGMEITVGCLEANLLILVCIRS